MCDSPLSKSKKTIFRSLRFWFSISIMLALVSISVLGIWSATDASFDTAVWKTKVVLRLEQLPKSVIANELGLLASLRSIQWDDLGKRVILIWLLTGIGIQATLCACYFTIGKNKWRQKLVCVFVFLCWFMLYHSQKDISDWRSYRQVMVILPKIEQIGNSLHKHWPQESGEIKSGIKFYMSPDKYPDVILLRGFQFSRPFNENMGHKITRSENGILRFALAASANSSVEFHPNGTFPTAYISGFGHHSPPVAAVTSLKDYWFLVRYSD